MQFRLQFRLRSEDAGFEGENDCGHSDEQEGPAGDVTAFVAGATGFDELVGDGSAALEDSSALLFCRHGDGFRR